MSAAQIKSPAVPRPPRSSSRSTSRRPASGGSSSSSSSSDVELRISRKNLPKSPERRKEQHRRASSRSSAERPPRHCHSLTRHHPPHHPHGYTSLDRAHAGWSWSPSPWMYPPPSVCCCSPPPCQVAFLAKIPKVVTEVIGHKVLWTN